MATTPYRAGLVVRGLDTITQKERLTLVAWLRKVAGQIEKPKKGEEYGKVAGFRLAYPPKK